MSEPHSLTRSDKIAVFTLIVTIVLAIATNRLNATLQSMFLLVALGASVYLCSKSLWSRWKKVTTGSLLCVAYLFIALWLFEQEARATNTVAPTTTLLQIPMNTLWNMRWRWIVPSVLLGAVLGELFTIRRVRKRPKMLGIETNEAYQRVHEIADRDKASIKDLVRVCAIYYTLHTERLQLHIDFVFFIFNNSLYQIVISDSILGYILFGTLGDRFSRSCEIESKQVTHCLGRAACRVTVRQYLDPTEVQIISNSESIYFWFEHLGMTFQIAGEEKATQLNTHHTVETKKGNWHVYDVPEYVFALDERQWADAIKGKTVESVAEIAALKSQCLELATINQELQKTEWMNIIADADAENIEKMIVTRSPSVSYDFSNQSPWLEFMFYIFNGTFYPIAIDSNIQGFMAYGGSRIDGQITQRPEWEIKDLKRGWTARVKFRLWLKPENVETWRKVFETQDSNPSKWFEFNDLIITVRGAEPFVDRVKPQWLVLNFRGVDTNQRSH